MEETIALRYILRSFGIEVEGPTLLLGDNLGVIQSATKIDGMLKKKHVAISYHRVREAVASGTVVISHIPSNQNVADLMTKALSGPLHRELAGMILE